MQTTYPSPTFLRPGDVSTPLVTGLEGRWSPVRFASDQEVASPDLAALLEAARWAPSTFGEEPWRFLVARRHDPWRPLMEAALYDGNAWARRASTLVVGLSRRTFTRNGRDNSNAAHDLGISLGAILAEATARGLATHPMGGFDAAAVRRDFGVPDDFDPQWVLAVGHHDPELDDDTLLEREARPRARRPLGETVFGAVFGEAAPI